MVPCRLLSCPSFYWRGKKYRGFGAESFSDFPAESIFFLQGENIYSGYFPFVRELLQNAIDSTKLQCYEDYRTSSKFRFEESQKDMRKPGIANLSKIINPVEYPIEITISCKKLNANDDYEDISLDEIPEWENEKKSMEYVFY